MNYFINPKPINMKVTFSAKLRHEYKSWTKILNDKKHLTNYINLMQRKGYHFIGIYHDERTQESLYVEAQENAYFDNFCRNNNI